MGGIDCIDVHIETTLLFFFCFFSFFFFFFLIYSFLTFVALYEFPLSLKVSVGDFDCTDVQIETPHTAISCLVAPGTGVNLYMNVDVAGQIAEHINFTYQGNFQKKKNQTNKQI